MAVDSAKIQIIIGWPTQTMKKVVCGFLSLAGYYRKSIYNFGCIAALLNRLLTKDDFYWNEEAAEAFNKIKKALSSLSILFLPDFSQNFVIKFDASAIGAIFSQKNRPLAYFSKALKGSVLALSTYKNKMSDIVK